MTADLRKMLITIVAILCITAMVLLNKVDGVAAVAVISTTTGIAIGNGKNALKGAMSAPLVMPKSFQEKERLDV